MESDTLYGEMHDAVASDNIDAIKRLVGQFSSSLEMDTAFGTWLNYASTFGKEAVVKTLVEMGADINARGGVANSSPLHSAASDGFLAIVQFLLSRGATLHIDRPESNPLFAAVSSGTPAIAKVLIDAGIDSHVVYRSVTGKLKNALSYAQERGEKEIVDLLLKAGCRLPIEGVDKPVWEPEKIYEPTPEDKAHERIITHVAEEFGPVDPLALQEVVPVLNDVHIAINVIRPTEGHPYLTLFTTGMCDRPMTVPPGQEAYQFAELVMHLPADWPHPRDAEAGDHTFWPFECLRNVAYYAHLNGTWLGGPRTIISSDEPPVPLGPNTKLTCLLLLVDFPDGRPLVLDDSKYVRFYTVIPIHTEERDFEKKHGIVPLIQRLQERGHTAVVNVHRASVASRLDL
jgi:hypothetical protein